MSDVIKINKGLDIYLVGKASNKIIEVNSDKFALKPPDFHGVFPKMMVSEGDHVKAGTPVYYNKYRDNILFTSPVSGTVKEIFRGAKRKLLEVRIEADGKMEYEMFGAADPNDLTRDQIKEKLLKSGVWPYIRQRPYSIIASPEDEPKSIFVSTFDSSPLGVDFDFIVEGKERLFQTGLDVLKKLTDGKVHLNIREGSTTAKAFLNASGVQVNRFQGPHPAGNIGTQVHEVDPINKGDIVWHIDPQSILIMGRLFAEGKYMAEKLVAFAGSEVENPGYCRVISGTNILPMVKGTVKEGDVRFISGSVFTGEKVEKYGYLGFYSNQLLVIPEGNYHEFFGWAMPRLDKFSFSKSYFSWLMPKKRYRLDTNLHGGPRAFVLTGLYEKVFPMDIYPMQLLKAILIKDLDQMENLGIYEVDEEDFALCEFVDVSKTEMQAIVRDGLNFMIKEMS